MFQWILKIKTIKINGLSYEQNIKPPKATRSESMVGFSESEKAKANNEENLCSG